jgi:ubiquitin carboxyl-terminal hydrolase 25/28
LLAQINDNPANKEIARKAVEIIANYRNSERLHAFLITGTVEGSGGMDTAEAYALFNIQDRAATIDLDTLGAHLGYMIEETPGNREKYEQAYALIKADQKNNKSTQSGSAISKKYPLDSWPVGCLNIGNTCYLNSVLQFLFTIKPLREMVLNCDEYLQDTSSEALKAKRVGRSEVTAEKVERAQQCKSIPTAGQACANSMQLYMN